MILLVPFLLMVQSDVAEAKRPHALQEMEHARRNAVASGTIEWSVKSDADQPGTLFYVTRRARNGDTIFENRGDQDGWTTFDSQTRQGTSRYPQIQLSNAEGEWAYLESNGSAYLHIRDGARPLFYTTKLMDIMAAGVHPLSRSIESEKGIDTIWQGVPGTEYNEVLSWEERTIDGKEEVVAHLSKGATLTWLINPEKGWNPERVSLREAAGTVTHEAVCELKRYGDVWLPATTRYFRMGKLRETVTIEMASVNKPTDPARFTGADIGLMPGCNISIDNGDPQGAVWNGDAISSWADWDADVAAGRRQWAPQFVEGMRTGKWRSEYSTTQEAAAQEAAMQQTQTERAVRKHEGLWEQYVRDFIARYKLNEDQSQQAWNILKQCQQDAERTMEQLRPRLAALEQRLDDARKKGDKKETQKIEAESEKLREPIDKIFETSLKPRLARLPTRAQRQAATTQPAPQSRP